MFWENKNLTKITDGVWVYKNFVSKEKIEEIESIMDKYKHNSTGSHEEGGTFYEEMQLNWYQDKITPLIPELYPIWQDLNKFLAPDYCAHPQLSMLIQREDDEMFIHADSPGEGMEENLTVTDLWNTCCILSYGAVIYFGKFEGGEVFYPHINSDGVFEGNRIPFEEGRELRYQPEAGDLVIHGALSDHAHGTKPVTSGYRYAYSNFVMRVSKAPGTFPLYNTKENDERWEKGPSEWMTPIGFVWEPSESLKADLEAGITEVRYKG